MKKTISCLQSLDHCLCGLLTSVGIVAPAGNDDFTQEPPRAFQVLLSKIGEDPNKVDTPRLVPLQSISQIHDIPFDDTVAYFPVDRIRKISEAIVSSSQSIQRSSTLIMLPNLNDEQRVYEIRHSGAETVDIYEYHADVAPNFEEIVQSRLSTNCKVVTNRGSEGEIDRRGTLLVKVNWKGGDAIYEAKQDDAGHHVLEEIYATEEALKDGVQVRSNSYNAAMNTIPEPRFSIQSSAPALVYKLATEVEDGEDEQHAHTLLHQLKVGEHLYEVHSADPVKVSEV